MCVQQLKWLFNSAALSCHWQNCEICDTHAAADVNTRGIHIQAQQASFVAHFTI